MGKTTNRVLSLVLTVLMVLSMVSVFALPAMAAETPATTAPTYDALLNSSNVYFIDKDWADRDLQAGKELEFTYNGVTKKFTYDAKKHFNSYEKAFDTIWSGLTAANYFTYNPTIVFGPGEYDELIHTPATCTILGNNAGISPNAAISDENWNTDYIGKNGGWPANTNRVEETVFAKNVLITTRAGKDWAEMPASGDGAKWAYLKEKGFNANSKGVTTTVIDGVKITAGSMTSHSGYDVSASFTYNNETMKPAGGRKILTKIKNTIHTGSTGFASAWNTNNDYFNVELDNCRSLGTLSRIFERYIDSGKIKNTFITGYTKRILDGGDSNAFFRCAKHTGVELTFEKSVIYNGPSTNVWAFYGQPNTTGFTVNFVDNLMYNVSGGNYGVFRIDNTGGLEQTYNLIGNEIYHDYANTKTYFNGNPDYITNGKVHINAHRNRFISPTVTAFVPNSEYEAAEAGSILYYNFDHNFWSTTRDGVGKKVTFGAGPKGNAALASGWDYRNPNYFYDYNMTYASNGTKIVSGNFGEGNSLEFKTSTIVAKCFNTDQVITPEFFVDEATLGSAKPKIEIATDIGFTDIIDTIDVRGVSGSVAYYVRAYYEGTDYERVYKLNVIAATPVDFNDNFMANGMNFAGYKLEYNNTAILVNDTVVEDGVEYAYGFLGDTYYRFKVDGDLVQKSLDEIETDMKGVKTPYIVLPSGEYGDMTFDFPATYIGANADLDPVDDTVSVLPDGSDWAIGEGWGDYGETGIGTITIADGTTGKMVFNGLTMRGNFNDTQRTMGKDGVAYGSLDITLKNIVVEQDGTAKIADTRTAYVKSLSGSAGGSGGAYLFNLINARSVNFDDTQKEYDEFGASSVVEYPGFGATNTDSFTIDSLWVKKSSSTARFLNEFVAPFTTITNVYRDATDAEAGTIVTWAKVGTATKNGAFKFNNNNIRNGVTTKVDHPVLGIEGSTRNNDAKRLPEGNTYDVEVSNNVFYNAHRENSAAKKLLSVEIAYLSSFKANNNFIYADDALAKDIGFIGYATTYATNAGADDLAVLGNIELKDNNIVGVNADVNHVELGMGSNTPSFENAFATTDTETYLTNKKAGIYVSAMGNSEYWLDFDRTISINKVRPSTLTPKTDKVSGQYIDNGKMEIGAIITAGKLSDIGIDLPEGVTGTWYSDEECTQAFEDKTFEEIGYNAIYYYKTYAVLDETVYEYTYKVDIYTIEFIDFADAQNLDPEYFSNNAVIVTDKAAGLATGSIIMEEWDGVRYRFYVGINAFATLQAADDTSAVPEILVPKATQENGVLNGSLDLVVNHSFKIYGPNYKTNPVINDGYSYDSPTKGEGWGYNTEYDKHKDDVRIKSVSVWTPAGDTVIELYGFTIDSAVNDNGRQVGSTVKFKLVNTLFTTSKGSGYIFTNQSYAHNTHYDYILSSQKNELYVKNAYFGSAETKNDFRLMGELVPAKVTFDNIHLDFIEAGLTNTSYIKNTASDSSIVFKNSYLKSSMVKDNNGHLQFEGLLIDGGDGYKGKDGDRPSDDKEKQTVPDGWKSQLVFDNNIIDGYLGYARDNNSNAMFRMTGASYNDIQITNNYLNFPAATGWYSGGADTTNQYKIIYGDSTAMWWSVPGKSSENGGDITTLKGKYVVTSNVMVGLKATRLDYGNGGDNNCLSGYDVVVEDNFITKDQSVDAFNPNVIGVPGVTRAKDQSGVGFYRLNASGTITTKTVNDYSFASRVTKNGTALSITGYENDLYTKVEGGYEFDLSAIIGKNIYGNVFTASYGDGDAVNVESGKVAVTADAFPAAGFTFTVTVDSIQGNAANKEVYTLTVTDGGAAPAFKGNYVNDKIKDTALVISAEADGTATVYERWEGMTYSFVSGTNAFKTVEDALAYAKTNALTDVQIILIDTNSTTDITVTYPCTLYGVNYDVLPHLKDGNGPDSPTNGEGWVTNVEYLDDQTHVDMIVLGEGFPTGGTFEVYGVTMHGPYADNRTTKENVAKVKLQNILLNLGTTKHTGTAKYMFDLQSAPSQNTAGNEFRLINTNLYAVASGRTAMAFIYGEWGPQTVVIDNFYVRDAAALKYDQSTAYIKSPANGASITITNSCFRSSIVQTTGVVNFEAMGSKTTETDTTKKTDLYFTNNIFSTMLGRDTSSSALFIVYAHAVDDCHFINNYVDNAKGTGTFGDLVYWGSIKIGSGGTIPNEIVTALQMNFVVKDNVLNGQTNKVIQATPSGKTGTIKITAENNYRTSAYVDDAYYAGVLGESLLIHSSNIQASTPYYALNYARDAYDKTIGVPEYEMLENLIVEADNSVTYKPDDKLFVDAGKIHGTVDHIIAGYPSYNTIALVVDGEPVALDATITAASTVAIRLTSKDGSTSKDFAVNVTNDSDHNFVDYDIVVDATCMEDAIGKATCDGSCGDTNCTAYTTKVMVGTSATAEHKWSRGGASNNDGTCLANGTMEVTCTVDGCGETKTVEQPNSKKAHEYINYVPEESATCAKAGTEKGTCKWCGIPNVRENAELYPIDKNKHNFGDWVYNNDASCTKDGTETRECDCGAKETRTSTVYTSETVGHAWGEYVYNGDVSCKTDGTMTARCTRENCRERHTIPDPNFKADDKYHTLGEYKYNGDATCCEDGTKTATCTTCKAKVTVAAPGTATGHKDVSGQFKDTETGKWYNNAVNYNVAHGFITGVAADKFGVSENVTRGMFVTILARIAGVDTTKNDVTTKFTDVAKGKYYTAAIKWASENAVVNGMSDTTFAPGTDITRQQLAVMIVNFAKAQNIALTAKTAAIKFADEASIASWAKAAVATCQQAGIINGYTENGKTNIKPNNTATRAEAAQMVYKFHSEFINK